MEKLCIAITGPDGSGKDTLAKMLAYLFYSEELYYNYESFKKEFDDYNYVLTNKDNIQNFLAFVKNITIAGFADPVNERFKDLTGIDFERLDRDEKEELRDKFILYAQTVKDITNNNRIWCEKLFDELEDNGKLKDIIIIKDLRFVEEYKFLKEKFDNLVTITILREESSLSLTDYTVFNTGTLENLFSQAIEIIIDLKEKYGNI